jgi:hypothetical protein
MNPSTLAARHTECSAAGMNVLRKRISRRLRNTSAAAIAVCILFAMSVAGADGRAVPAAREKERNQTLDAVDVAQVEDNRVYHLHEAGDLIVYDVSEPDRPRVVGRHAIVGWPLGMIIRDKVATIVMRGTDVPSARGSTQGSATVRAVDLHDPSHPRVIGESVIDGWVSDARASESRLYVLSESHASAVTQTVVTALRLDGSDVLAPHKLHRDGSVGALRVTDGRIVLAHVDEARPGTSVDVLADDATTGLVVRGSVNLTATMDREVRDVSERLDAADPAHVRVLGCRAGVCMAGDTLEVATIDVTDPARPVVVSKREVRSPGQWLATRFDGRHLYLSGRGPLGSAVPTTRVLAVDLDANPQREAQVVIPGAIAWNILSVGSRLFVVATRADEELRTQEVLFDSIVLRNGGAPSLDAEWVLGYGLASSPAQVTSRAVSVCGSYLSVTFRQWETGARSPTSAVALFRATRRGLERSHDVGVHGAAERLVCVNERLFALSDVGIWPISATGGASAALSESRKVDAP